MRIHPISVLSDNYVWTIIQPENKAIIVDPGESKPVIDFLEKEKLQLKAIFITHKHWDHTNGISDIVQKYNIPVFGPANDFVATVDHPVKGDDEIKIESFPTFKIIDIPGHTLGHIAYVGDDVLFSGDTLFSAGCGKIFEGTPPQMFASLKKLSNLPASTKLYCGHEYTLNNLKFAKAVEPSNPAIDKRIQEVKQLRAQDLASLPVTLEIELQTNPFLRCREKEIITNVETYAGKHLTNDVEVFANLREYKNEF